MISKKNIAPRRISILFHFALPALAAFVLFGSTGCEDPLPIYVEPKNIFAATFVRADSTLIQYYETDEKDYTPEGPIISYNMFVANFQFIFAVENRYEETIEGAAAIEGKLEVWNSAHPEIKGTIPITVSQIIPGPSYNAATNSILMNPGDKTFFLIKWNYRFDSGTWLHQTLDVTGQQIRTTRSWYLFHSPAFLSSRLTVTLFKNTPAVIAEAKTAITVQGVIQVTKP